MQNTIEFIDSRNTLSKLAELIGKNYLLQRKSRREYGDYTVSSGGLYISANSLALSNSVKLDLVHQWASLKFFSPREIGEVLEAIHTQDLYNFDRLYRTAEERVSHQESSWMNKAADFLGITLQSDEPRKQTIASPEILVAISLTERDASLIERLYSGHDSPRRPKFMGHLGNYTQNNPIGKNGYAFIPSNENLRTREDFLKAAERLNELVPLAIYNLIRLNQKN